MNMAEQELKSENTASSNELSALLISLLKGVIYQESDASLWNALLNLQARVRDYVTVLGLELVLDEAEGYAFLRARQEFEDEGVAKLPRLVARRPLTFPVSLLLALLRKKLAEFDASGGDTRLVLTRDQLVELVRVFLPDSSNVRIPRHSATRSTVIRPPVPRASGRVSRSEATQGF